MTLPARIRKAVASGDYSTALSLLRRLSPTPATAADLRETIDLLAWALAAARTSRAHDAALLAGLTCSSAYVRPIPRDTPTFSLEA